MKVQKLFSLDLELVKLLKKEDNGSAVVNALLIAHYSKIKTNKNEEEIIAEAKANIKAEENAIREREYEEMARKEYLEKDKLEWENTPEEKKQAFQMQALRKYCFHRNYDFCFPATFK